MVDVGLRNRKNGGATATASDPLPPSPATEAPAPVQEPISEKRTDDKAPKSGNGFVIDLRLLILTVMAIISRIILIHHPSKVVFDEVHFGLFAVHYNTGKFFFDVHPPLGKMMFAFAGWLGGLGDHFLFTNIGDDYSDKDVPYVLMRMFPALFGAALVPMVYLTLAELGFSRWTATLGASLILLDNALLTQSRFILLDSFMIFYIFLSIFFLAKFIKCRSAPFSLSWWTSLVFLGLALAGAISVKYVGIFVISIVGLYIASELWGLWGDRANSLACIAAHFGARAVALIALPIAVYIGIFALHFALLPRSGSGDAFLSQPFQATLEGNIFAEPLSMPRTVAIGSEILLKSVHTKDASCWLHSHPHRYPFYPSGDEKGLVSSHQQQVTCYQWPVDENNWWVVESLEDSPVASSDDSDEVTKPQRPPQLIKHGDVVRLRHKKTGFPLNSHDVAGPLTVTAHEVSCYQPGDERVPKGQAGHMPLSDKWRFEVVANVDPVVNVINTRFRLIHNDTGARLHSTGKVLPEWGFKQLEVVGEKVSKDPMESLWIVENHVNPALPVEKEMTRAKLGFVDKTIELHREMFKANNRLLQDHVYGSRPLSWSLLTKGVSFWQGHDNDQIYLIGNPVVWWLCLAGVGLYTLLFVGIALRRQRGYEDFEAKTLFRFYLTGGVFLLGWIFHYLPFFIMDRQLFLHHYLPALVFGILLAAAVLEIITLGLLKSVRLHILTVLTIILLALVCFAIFAPFSYGTQLPKDGIVARKWLPGWNFQTEFRKN